LLKEWTRLIGHRAQVHALAFSEDGLALVSGGRDDLVHVWNPESGELLSTLETASAGLGPIAFAGDGSIIAAHWREIDEVRVYEAVAGALVAQLPASGVTSMAISPDSQHLVVASAEGLALWNLAELRLEGTCGGAARDAAQVRYDPTGEKLFLAAPIPRTFDARTLAPAEVLYAHTLHAFDRACCLDLALDEGRVAVGWGHSEGREGGSVRVIEWPEGRSIQVLRGHQPAVGSVCFAPGGRHVVSVGVRDSLVRVWQAATAHVLEEHRIPGAKVAAFSPTGVFLATGAFPPASLVIWEWTP